MDNSQFGCNLLFASPSREELSKAESVAKNVTGSMSADSLALSLSLSASQQGSSALQALPQNRLSTASRKKDASKQYTPKQFQAFDDILADLSPEQSIRQSIEAAALEQHNANGRIPATPATTKMATEYARNLDMLLQSPMQPDQVVDSPESISAAAVAGVELHDSVLQSLAQGAAFTPAPPSERKPQDTSFASTQHEGCHSFAEEPLSFVSDITGGSPEGAPGGDGDAWAWDVPNALTATLDSTPQSYSLVSTPASTTSAALSVTGDMDLSAVRRSSGARRSLAHDAPPGVQQLPTVQDEDTVVDSAADSSSVCSTASLDSTPLSPAGEFVSGAAAEALLDAAEAQHREDAKFRITKAQLATVGAATHEGDLSGHLPGGVYLHAGSSAAWAQARGGSADSSVMSSGESPCSSAPSGSLFTPYFQQRSWPVGALGGAASAGISTGGSDQSAVAVGAADCRRSSGGSAPRRLAASPPSTQQGAVKASGAVEQVAVVASSPATASRASSRQRGHNTMTAASSTAGASTTTPAIVTPQVLRGSSVPAPQPGAPAPPAPRAAPPTAAAAAATNTRPPRVLQQRLPVRPPPGIVHTAQVAPSPATEDVPAPQLPRLGAVPPPQKRMPTAPTTNKTAVPAPQLPSQERIVELRPALEQSSAPAPASKQAAPVPCPQADPARPKQDLTSQPRDVHTVTDSLVGSNTSVTTAGGSLRLAAACREALRHALAVCRQAGLVVGFKSTGEGVTVQACDAAPVVEVSMGDSCDVQVPVALSCSCSVTFALRRDIRHTPPAGKSAVKAAAGALHSALQVWMAGCAGCVWHVLLHCAVAGDAPGVPSVAALAEPLPAAAGRGKPTDGQLHFALKQSEKEVALRPRASLRRAQSSGATVAAFRLSFSGAATALLLGRATAPSGIACSRAAQVAITPIAVGMSACEWPALPLWAVAGAATAQVVPRMVNGSGWCRLRALDRPPTSHALGDTLCARVPQLHCLLLHSGQPSVVVHKSAGGAPSVLHNAGERTAFVVTASEHDPVEPRAFLLPPGASQALRGLPPSDASLLEDSAGGCGGLSISLLWGGEAQRRRVALLLAARSSAGNGGQVLLRDLLRPLPGSAVLRRLLGALPLGCRELGDALGSCPPALLHAVQEDDVPAAVQQQLPWRALSVAVPREAPPLPCSGEEGGDAADLQASQDSSDTTVLEAGCDASSECSVVLPDEVAAGQGTAGVPPKQPVPLACPAAGAPPKQPVPLASPAAGAPPKQPVPLASPAAGAPPKQPVPLASPAAGVDAHTQTSEDEQLPSKPHVDACVGSTSVSAPMPASTPVHSVTSPVPAGMSPPPAVRSAAQSLRAISCREAATPATSACSREGAATARTASYAPSGAFSPEEGGHDDFQRLFDDVSVPSVELSVGDVQAALGDSWRALPRPTHTAASPGSAADTTASTAPGVGYASRAHVADRTPGSMGVDMSGVALWYVAPDCIASSWCGHVEAPPRLCVANRGKVPVHLGVLSTVPWLGVEAPVVTVPPRSSCFLRLQLALPARAPTVQSCSGVSVQGGALGAALQSPTGGVYAAARGVFTCCVAVFPVGGADAPAQLTAASCQHMQVCTLAVSDCVLRRHGLGAAVGAPLRSCDGSSVSLGDSSLQSSGVCGAGGKQEAGEGVGATHSSSSNSLGSMGGAYHCAPRLAAMRARLSGWGEVSSPLQLQSPVALTGENRHAGSIAVAGGGGGLRVLRFQCGQGGGVARMRLAVHNHSEGRVTACVRMMRVGEGEGGAGSPVSPLRCGGDVPFFIKPQHCALEMEGGAYCMLPVYCNAGGAGRGGCSVLLQVVSTDGAGRRCVHCEAMLQVD